MSFTAPSTRAFLALSLVLTGTPVAAAITAPPLALSAAHATPTPVGTLLRVEGTFPQPDLVQQPLEIQLLVRNTASGGRFLRYELPVGGFGGIEPLLADGLQGTEIGALLSASSAEPDLRLLLLAPDRIELLLPSDFPSGPAVAQLFLIYRGEPLLSNPVSLEIPGLAP